MTSQKTIRYASLIVKLRLEVNYGCSPGNPDGLMNELFQLYALDDRVVVWQSSFVTDYNPIPFLGYTGWIPCGGYFRDPSINDRKVFDTLEEAIRSICRAFEDAGVQIEDTREDKWVTVDTELSSGLEREDMILDKVNEHLSRTILEDKQADHDVENRLTATLRLTTDPFGSPLFDWDEFIVFWADGAAMVKHRYFLKPGPDPAPSDDEFLPAQEWFVDRLAPIRKMDFPSVMEAILAVCREDAAVIEIQLAGTSTWINLVDEIISSAWSDEKERAILQKLRTLLPELM